MKALKLFTVAANVVLLAFGARGDHLCAASFQGADTFYSICVLTLEDWSEPVFLERNGNDWTLPAGESAQFFCVQLSE